MKKFISIALCTIPFIGHGMQLSDASSEESPYESQNEPNNIGFFVEMDNYAILDKDSLTTTYGSIIDHGYNSSEFTFLYTQGLASCVGIMIKGKNFDNEDIIALNHWSGINDFKGEINEMIEKMECYHNINHESIMIRLLLPGYRKDQENTFCDAIISAGYDCTLAEDIIINEEVNAEPYYSEMEFFLRGRYYYRTNNN